MSELTKSIDRLEEEEFAYLLDMIAKHPTQWRAMTRKAWDDPRYTHPIARTIRNSCAEFFYRFNEKNLTAGRERLWAWKARVAKGENCPTR